MNGLQRLKMPKKKLPDGRIIDEPVIDLAPPPVGNVDWIAKRKLETIVKAFVSKEAKKKAAEIFKCDISKVHVEPKFEHDPETDAILRENAGTSKHLNDVFERDEWLATTEVQAIVNAHTFFEARAKAVTALRCDMFQLTLEQAPKSTNGEATRGQDGPNAFDPWASLRKSVKRARKRGVYR